LAGIKQKPSYSSNIPIKISRGIILLSQKTILPVTGIFLCLLLLIPGVSAYAEKLNLGSREIIMNMTWPEPDDVYYCDTPPCYMWVTGQVFGSDIRNVTVVHGNSTQECGYDTGKYFLVNCSMEVTDRSDQVVLTVRDSRGAMTSVTRNVFFYTMPGPESIWVNGYVLDSSGIPVKDAVIDFQSFHDNRSFTISTRTDMNGWYSMKRTYGSHQNITVHKEGYETISRSTTFGWWHHDRMDFKMAGVTNMPSGPGEPGSNKVMLTPMATICSNWHLWCNHLQEKTKNTNPSLKNDPSIPIVSQIIRVTDADIQTTTVSTESDTLSKTVVKPGDMVSIDLKMGDNKNNISIKSYVTLMAGQTTHGYSVMPGTSDQSPDSRIFTLFPDEYNAISSGLIGMKTGEQKNISVHFKDRIETKTMSSEYLKKYKINASNLSAGKLFVGIYSEPNSSTRSTMLGKVVSATHDYAQVDFSYPDIHIKILEIKNGSTNTAPSSQIGTQSPAIQRVSPTSGPASGGTLVTITGTNLSGIHTINFGKSRANSIGNVSDTTITAITPPSEPGAVSLYFQAPQWLGTYDGFVFTKRVFTESDNGKTYEIPGNTEFFVNVTESFATGTKWHPRVSSGLEILDDEYYANPKSVRVDIGGTRSWKNRAAGTGQQSFQADFYPFDNSDKVQQHYALTLNIRPG
jgi:predicted secreted protein